MAIVLLAIVVVFVVLPLVDTIFRPKPITKDGEFTVTVSCSGCPAHSITVPFKEVTKDEFNKELSKHNFSTKKVD